MPVITPFWRRKNAWNPQKAPDGDLTLSTAEARNQSLMSLFNFKKAPANKHNQQSFIKSAEVFNVSRRFSVIQNGKFQIGDPSEVKSVK